MSDVDSSLTSSSPQTEKTESPPPPTKLTPSEPQTKSGGGSLSSSARPSTGGLSLLKSLSDRAQSLASSHMKWAIVLGSLVVLAILVFFVWPGWSSKPAAKPGMEFCEFLARPAAKLYIDGKLVNKEVPPIHSTQLKVGEHTIRFVSPGNKEHKTTIKVVRGKRVQWFMNFVEGRIHERPTAGVNTK